MNLQEVADKWHVFFQNSATENYGHLLQQTKQQLEATEIVVSEEDNNYNQSFTMHEILRTMKKSKGKSVGPDGVSYGILKNLCRNAKEELLKLFNHVWTKKKFPVEWRKSLILPILKSGMPRDDPMSYRPIILTNTICKLIERMIKKRLMWTYVVILLNGDERIPRDAGDLTRLTIVAENYVPAVADESMLLTVGA
jgi:hypothetical protein